MLSASQNERLTRVGPGTPMGELMRRYWQPFLPVAKLAENPVQKVRLLGEDLVCYRDRSGTVGLIGDRCAHRQVHMELGIPEETGLRCPYHGWCYDEQGRCIETPLEAPGSRLKDRVHLTSYPVKEMGGLLFGYLGPPPAPLLPPWDLFVWPNAIRQVGYCVIPCNWLQCQENASDPAHNIYLHGRFFEHVLERQGLLEARASDRATHRAYTSMRSGIGFDRVICQLDTYGQRKALVYSKAKGAEDDAVRWFPYVVFPNYTRPTSGLRFEFQVRVPVDDTHTYHVFYDIYTKPGVTLDEQETVPCYEVPLFDEQGRPILDFVLGQDMAAWWSQGPITDRTSETLAATDTAIVQYRKLLMDQVRRVEKGLDPINVFRDPAQMGDIIHLEPRVDAAAGDPIGTARHRALYHKGYYLDDHDRYGPALEQVKALMALAEEEAAASTPG
jgi:5,5'-dehydrodivanillate O-demethylase